MNKCRYMTVLALAVVLLSIMGCSNDSPEDDAADRDSSQTYDQNEPDDLGAYPEGWRPGTLKLTLKISQHGDAVEESNAQGGTKSVIKWDFMLAASQKFAVMIPPDFTVVLPDYEADAIDPFSLEEDIYIALEDEAPVTQGQVSYKGRMDVRTPLADDIVLQIQDIDVQAELGDLSLRSVRPSSVGKGFDVNLQFEYKMSGLHKTTSKHQGGLVQEHEADCCSSEFQRESFFPDSDLDMVQRIIYPLEEGLPPIVAETNQKIRLDMVSSLQRIAANLEPRTVFHPGMRWVAEPNQLKLRYHSESQNLLPQGGLLSIAAPPTQRSYTLEITIKAD